MGSPLRAQRRRLPANADANAAGFTLEMIDALSQKLGRTITEKDVFSMGIQCCVCGKNSGGSSLTYFSDSGTQITKMSFCNITCLVDYTIDYHAPPPCPTCEEPFGKPHLEGCAPGLVQTQ